jgi:3-hydroxybutyryl-CoA dehydrogenase
MKVEKIGVVGCGIMGSGIAQNCAQSGYQVVALDVSEEIVNKGLKVISSSLRRSVDKGRISQQDMNAVLGHIKGTTNMNDFAECDLIIEAVIEELEVKKKIFSQLDQICPSHTILATNTSLQIWPQQRNVLNKYWACTSPIPCL